MGKGRISIGPDGAGNQKKNTDVKNSADRAKGKKVNGMMMNSTLGIHGRKEQIYNLGQITRGFECHTRQSAFSCGQLIIKIIIKFFLPTYGNHS